MFSELLAILKLKSPISRRYKLSKINRFRKVTRSFAVAYFNCLSCNMQIAMVLCPYFSRYSARFLMCGVFSLASTSCIQKAANFRNSIMSFLIMAATSILIRYCSLYGLDFNSLICFCNYNVEFYYF